MTQRIHPTAIIAPEAELHDTVEVGPYAVIGPHVSIGAGTTIGAHCVVEGCTRIGQDNRIHPFASIGGIPQDKKYAGEPTRLEIGNGNTIREGCTLNIGTEQGGGLTRLGDDNWLMAYVHVAHDCLIGSHTVIANAVQLGGHVEVGDWVVIGGISGVHQFTRIGAHAMVGFSSRLAQDLPPFVTAAGNPAQAQGINAEGLRRRGFSAERQAVVKVLYRLLYRKSLPLAEALAEMGRLEVAEGAAGDVAMMCAFLERAGRGVVR